MNIDTAKLLTGISRYVSKDNIIPFVKYLNLNIETILKSDLIVWIDNPFKDGFCVFDNGHSVDDESPLDNDFVSELMYVYAQKNHWYYWEEAKAFYRDLDALIYSAEGDLHNGWSKTDTLIHIYGYDDLKKIPRADYERINEYLINTLHVDEESVKSGDFHLTAEQLARFWIYNESVKQL